MGSDLAVNGQASSGQGLATKPAGVLPTTFEQMQQVSSAVYDSGIFPALKNKAMALAMGMVAHDEGISITQALRQYHFIQGQLSMKAEAMHAKFQLNGGRLLWNETDGKVADATFFHPIHAPDPGLHIRVTMADMDKTGYTRTNANYGKFPAQMLRARVISQGVRALMPGLTNGIYTPEEMQDMIPAEVVRPQPGRNRQPEAIEVEVVERAESPRAERPTTHGVQGPQGSQPPRVDRPVSTAVAPKPEPVIESVIEVEDEAEEVVEAPAPVAPPVAPAPSAPIDPDEVEAPAETDEPTEPASLADELFGSDDDSRRHDAAVDLFYDLCGEMGVNDDYITKSVAKKNPAAHKPADLTVDQLDEMNAKIRAFLDGKKAAAAAAPVPAPAESTPDSSDSFVMEDQTRPLNKTRARVKAE